MLGLASNTTQSPKPHSRVLGIHVGLKEVPHVAGVRSPGLHVDDQRGVGTYEHSHRAASSGRPSRALVGIGGGISGGVRGGVSGGAGGQNNKQHGVIM